MGRAVVAADRGYPGTSRCRGTPTWVKEILRVCTPHPVQMQGTQVKEIHHHSQAGDPEPGSAPVQAGRCQLFVQAFVNRSGSHRVVFPPSWLSFFNHPEGTVP